MGGAQQPHVDRQLGHRADRPHRALLDRAQQLRLHRQRQVADLVEEQRAAVGGLEEALAVVVRAGERALAVAEELGLEQVLGDRAAVDRHERHRAAHADFVDRAGDELLAGARLAGDEHRRHAASDLLDQLAHLLHRHRLSGHACQRGAHRCRRRGRGDARRPRRRRRRDAPTAGSWGRPSVRRCRRGRAPRRRRRGTASGRPAW